MDDKHRANIIENTDKLINRTEYEKLAHACKAKGLLSPIMLQNLEKIEPDMCVNWSEDEKQYERHKRLFIKITKRGPTAYQELRMILADLKYDSALCVLNALDDDSRMRSIQKREDQKYERQLSGIRECEALITTNGNNNNNSNDMHCIDRSDGAKKVIIIVLMFLTIVFGFLSFFFVTKNEHFFFSLTIYKIQVLLFRVYHSEETHQTLHEPT